MSGNGKDSNFLNKATRSREKCKLQMRTLNKIQNSKHSQLERGNCSLTTGLTVTVN